MFDAASFIVICISMAIGYWVGTVNGFGLGQRTADKSKILNVVVTSIDGKMLGYELKSKRYIGGGTNQEELEQDICGKFPEHTIVFSHVESV